MHSRETETGKSGRAGCARAERRRLAVSHDQFGAEPLYSEWWKEMGWERNSKSDVQGVSSVAAVSVCVFSQHVCKANEGEWMRLHSSFLVVASALHGHFLSQNLKGTLRPDSSSLSAAVLPQLTGIAQEEMTSAPKPLQCGVTGGGKAAWPCLPWPLLFKQSCWPPERKTHSSLRLPSGLSSHIGTRLYMGKVRLKAPCSQTDLLTWSKTLTSPLPEAWASKVQHQLLSTAFKLHEVRQALISEASWRAALCKLQHLQELKDWLWHASLTSTHPQLPGVCRTAEGLSWSHIFLPLMDFY